MLLAMIHHGHDVSFAGWGWLIVGGLVLLVLLVAALVYFRGRQGDGLSRAERRDLGPMEAEILAMLRQTGRPVVQSEIGDTVPMDPDDIAQAVQDLESRGLVHREWSSERQAYIVTPS